mgnify:CR=1 FL=1
MTSFFVTLEDIEEFLHEINEIHEAKTPPAPESELCAGRRGGVLQPLISSSPPVGPAALRQPEFIIAWLYHILHPEGLVTGNANVSS